MSATSFGLPDPAASPAFYKGVTFKRGVAFLLDTFLIGIVSAMVVPFTFFTGLFYFPFLMLVVGFLYRWFTLAGGSSTWGMRLMAIEIRDKDGARLSSENALLHTLGFSVSMMVFPLQLISVGMMVLTPRSQGLSDHLLGTAAINRTV